MPTIMHDGATDASTDALVHSPDDVRRYVTERTPPHVDRGFWLYGAVGSHLVAVQADPRDDGGHSIEIEPCSQCGAVEGACLFGSAGPRRTSWARLLEDEE